MSLPSRDAASSTTTRPVRQLVFSPLTQCVVTQFPALTHAPDQLYSCISYFHIFELCLETVAITRHSLSFCIIRTQLPRPTIRVPQRQPKIVLREADRLDRGRRPVYMEYVCVHLAGHLDLWCDLRYAVRPVCEFACTRLGPLNKLFPLARDNPRGVSVCLGFLWCILLCYPLPPPHLISVYC